MIEFIQVYMFVNDVCLHGCRKAHTQIENVENYLNELNATQISSVECLTKISSAEQKKKKNNVKKW